MTAVLINVSTGFFVDRMPVILVVLVSATLSAISPLLMAVVNPHWPYWYMAFIAQVRGIMLLDDLLKHHTVHYMSQNTSNLNQPTSTYVPLILGLPAHLPRCTFYGRHTNHLSRLPGQDSSSRRSSFQYLLSTWYFGRVNHNISYFRLRHS